jgi:hypothetical protein
MALALSPTVLHGQTVSSNECCIDMLFPVGARTVSLGDAATARPGQDAAFINPAGLIGMRDDQFFAHRSSLADAKVTTLGVLFMRKDVGAFGVAYHLVDFGSQETTDEFGNPNGTASIIYQQLVASFATRIAFGWSAGINYRLYDFRPSCTGLSCGESAKPGTTHMVDVGVTYEPRFMPSARFGASLLHVGFPLQVNNAAQADPTPARLRVGAAYEAGHHFARDTALAVWVHADAIVRARDPGAPAIGVGVEVVLDQIIYFRAGYSNAGDGITAGGTGLGIGLQYQRFDVSVAKTVSTSSLFPGEPFHVSFAVSF